MKENNPSIEEIENLGYYDLMSFLGTPFFHLGGPESSENLARLCRIDNNSKVLMVGCGSGFTAFYLAKKFGCSVVGVDIAEVSIEEAKERAKKEDLEDKVEFQIGDAYDLPFEDCTFDTVITEFVSQFLDQDKAFREFVRVLKPGGCVGINEMFKERDIPPQAAEEIIKIEQIINDLTQLPFKLHSPEDWKKWLKNAGLVDVQVQEHRKYMGIRDSPYIIKEMGGWGKVVGLMARMAKYTLISKKIRNRFKQLQKVKYVLMRKKTTSRHVGYILGTGYVPAF